MALAAERERLRTQLINASETWGFLPEPSIYVSDYHMNESILAGLAMLIKGQTFFQNAKIHERSKYKNK